MNAEQIGCRGTILPSVFEHSFAERRFGVVRGVPTDPSAQISPRQWFAVSHGGQPQGAARRRLVFRSPLPPKARNLPARPTGRVPRTKAR
jgi:hypothetical protein